MRFMDFSSWQGILFSVLGIALFALIGMGIRILMMMTLQQRQQRMNRQINERLRALMAAYKVLGGSFTGQLTVDPRHLRELRAATSDEIPLPLAETPAETEDVEVKSGETTVVVRPGGERARQIRDAVEAALADILLLGTEEHVRLAGQAAGDLAAGRPIHTAELVVSLRNYIRTALDLGEIPSDVAIPLQGPTRPQSGRDRGGGQQGRGGSGGGMGGGGGGMGMGMGLGMGAGRREE